MPVTNDTTFDRDGLAKWYARRHYHTDPGVRDVYHLPGNAPDREIRLLEINGLIPDRSPPALEPVDFGVNDSDADGHTLVVLDVTPSEWDSIRAGCLHLPPGWTLDGQQHLPR